MAPRMSTGFGGSTAKDDFDRARRRRIVARAARTVGRNRADTDELVPLAEVVAALGQELTVSELAAQATPEDRRPPPTGGG